MRAVDTNVLVRLMVRDDPKQTAAAEDFVKAGGWVPHITLAETVWVLESYYEKTRLEIGNVVAGLLDHKTLIVQDADVVTSALKKFQSSKGVQFADCLILEVARKAGHTPLGTFDAKLAKIDGAALV
jgi:predicted nucleic-acid-binding protein